MIVFRVGANDAPMLAAHLGLERPGDLLTQPNYLATVRMMLDNAPSRAFSMTTHA